MDKKQIREKVSQGFRMVRPWLLYLALFLVLRFTGILSYASTVTQHALMKTGALDAASEPSMAKKFDYNFSLYDINGNKVDANSLKGKTLFINLWATWCGPCRVEMPSIQNLYNSVDKDKVAFVMLALDQKDPVNKVKSYITEKNFTFPVYFPATSLPELLHVKTIPTTFIVNSQGVVVLKETGSANYDTEEFRDFIKKQSSATVTGQP